MRKDYPEPGMVSFHISSLPDDPTIHPLKPKCIRAKMIIVGFMFIPKIDPITNKEFVEIFAT